MTLQDLLSPEADGERTFDNWLIGVLVAIIVTVVVVVMFTAVDMNDVKQQQPLVPPSVYQHPKEEP